MSLSQALNQFAQNLGRYPESATNGPDHEWLYKESAMPDNGPELKINIPYAVEARVNVVYASDWKGSTFQPLADIYDGNSTSKNTTGQSE